MREPHLRRSRGQPVHGHRIQELAEAGAKIDRIAGTMGFGDCVRARFPHLSDAPGILVMGHLDTAHPIGTLAKLPWRLDGGRCYGPGILDMKGGTTSSWKPCGN